MKIAGGIYWSDEEHAFVHEAATAVDKPFSRYARALILAESEKVLKRKAPVRMGKLDVSSLTNGQREAIKKIMLGEK